MACETLRLGGCPTAYIRFLLYQSEVPWTARPPVLCQAGMSAYSGSSYDRWAYEQSAPGANDTALNKLQHKYWVAKQGGEKEIDAILL